MCDAIIVCCLSVLMVIGGVSFFVDPRYEKGVWIVLAAVTHLLSAAAGAKFGLAVPSIVQHLTAEDEQPDPEPKHVIGFASPTQELKDGREP